MITRNKKFKINKNQKSFIFEDYFETKQKNQKEKYSSISQDRIYLLFFLFFSLILIFSIKITLVSLKKPENFKNNIFNAHKFILRRDIVDRNGTLISRNIN